MNLALLNFVLFCLHLCSAIYVFHERNEVPKRFREVEVFANKLIPASGPNQQYSFASQSAFTLDVPVLISIFFLFTSLFHLAYFLGRNSWYKTMLVRGWNPVRWIEYSITASIMAVILALCATLQDGNSLLLIVGATISIMLLGLGIERSLLNKDIMLAALLEKIGWILQIMVFVVIGNAFVRTIKTVNEKLKSEAAKQVIPDWVYILLGAELFFFASFGFVSFVQVYRQYKGLTTQFESYETAYHLLSLGAKLTLGWLFYFGTTKAK
jgi:hypothetical protein